MLELVRAEDDAIILEFKMYDSEDESTLADTLETVLTQIKKNDMRQFWSRKELCERGFGNMGLRFRERKY